jgi:probable HAF family extracellular repeat protein
MSSSFGRREFLTHGLGAALATTSLAGRAASAWPRYRVTDMGDLGGGTIIVNGINEHGVAVGMATRHDGDNKGVGFISKAGRMRGLRMDQRSVSSSAVAINSLGVVAGYDLENANVSYDQNAWTWQGGTRQYFDKVSEHDSAFATDINDAGVVTGFLYPSFGVLWRDGQRVDLSAETGRRIVQANAINQAGDVACYGLGTRGRVQSYVCRQGTAILLDVLGSPQHEATDINAAGQVCGRYRQVVDEQRGYGYLWQNGVAIDLGQLPGPDQSIWPLALNDAGMVVGSSSVIAPDSPRVPHAFIWQDGTMVDLNRLIDGDHDGWVLNKAVDINNLGQIVGQGTHHGVPRAFLVTPVA